jgi:NADP-dependent 3-hydroxy acid dehydrogenase YdfG
MAKKLNGKVALVTGASSGIGEATAVALAAEGARVAVAARRTDRLARLVERVRHEGGEATAIEADLGQRESAESMVRVTRERFGRLDILVNNAGVMFLGPAIDGNPDDWRQMIEVNLLGLLYATHAVLPAMKSLGGGHIVNVSSVAGRIGFTYGAAYSATKFGVRGFSDALRKENTKNNIRVSVIEPGYVATELSEHLSNDPNVRAQFEEWAKAIKRPLKAEDIAAAIAYVVTQPDHVDVDELSIRPTDQDF